MVEFSGKKNKADKNLKIFNKQKDWMKAAGKSVGFSAYEALGRYAPNINKTISTNKDIVTNSQIKSKFNSEIKANAKKLTDQTKKSVKETIGSFKTGEFYSKDRAKAGENELLKTQFGDDFDMNEFDNLDSFDFDSDDDSDFNIEDDDDFLDDEDSPKESTIKPKINLNNTYNKNTVIDASGFSNTDIFNTNSILEKASVAIISINSIGFERLTDSISQVSNTVEEGATNYSAATQKTLDALNAIKDNLSYSTINDITKSKSIEDMLEGTFSLANIISSLDDNIDMVTSGMSSLVGMTSDVLANPIANLMKYGIKKQLNKFDKKTGIFSGINDSIGSSHLTALNKIKDLDDRGVSSKVINKVRTSKLGSKFLSNDKIDDLTEFMGLPKGVFNSSTPLTNIINKTLGIETKGIKTSAAKKADEKVDFDALTHNSINVVIPGYLSKILQSFTGKSLHYSYNDGTWSDKEGYDKSEDKNLMKSVLSSSRAKEILAPAYNGIAKNKDKYLDDVLSKFYKNKDLSNENDSGKILDKLFPSKTDDDLLGSVSFDESKLKDILTGSGGSKIGTYQKMGASKFFKESRLGSMFNLSNDKTGLEYTNRNKSKAEVDNSDVDLYNTELKTTDLLINNIKEFLSGLKNLKFPTIDEIDDQPSSNESDDNKTNSEKDTRKKENSTKSDSDNNDSSDAINEEKSSTNNEDKKSSKSNKDEGESSSKNSEEESHEEDDSLEGKYKSGKDKVEKFKKTKLGSKFKESKLGSKIDSKYGKITKKLDGLVDGAKSSKAKLVDKVLDNKTVDKVLGSKVGGKLATSAVGSGMIGKLGGDVAENIGSRVAAKAGTQAAENAIAKTGAKVAEKAVGSAAIKAGGKALGKGVLKSLPFVGTLFSGVSAIKNVLTGNFKDAAFDVAQGALDMTGVGAVGSLALTGVQMASDVADATGSASADTVQGYNTESTAQPAFNPLEGSMGGAISTLTGGLMSKIGSVANIAFKLSPLGMLSAVPNVMKTVFSNPLVTAMKSGGLTAGKLLAQTAFAATPIGGLFGLAGGFGSNVAIGGIGKLFSSLFSKIGKLSGGGSSSSNTSDSSDSSSSSSDSSSSSATVSSSIENLAKGGKTSTTTKGSNSSSSGSSNTVPSSGSANPLAGLPKASTATNDVSKSLLANNDSLGVPVAQGIKDQSSVTVIPGTPTNKPVVIGGDSDTTKIPNLDDSSSVITYPDNTLKLPDGSTITVNGQGVPESSTVTNSDTQYIYDYNQYLVLKDILGLIDSIEDDTLSMDTELSNVLESIKNGKSNISDGNDLRRDTNKLLGNLAKQISVYN